MHRPLRLIKPSRPGTSVVRPIGAVELIAGIESVVTLSTTGSSGFVILDAIQLLLENHTPNETNCFQQGLLPNAGYTHDATYVRSNDVTGNFNDNGQLIVGVTEGGAADVLRSVFEFDISALPTSVPLGPVSLALTTYSTPGINNMGGPGALTTFDLYSYAFDLDESSATWNTPGIDDSNAGGTTSNLLSTASLDVEATGQRVTFVDTPAFQTAVSDALASDGMLRLLLRINDETTGTHNFARFVDETFLPANHRPQLCIELQLEAPVIRIAHTSGTASITFTSSPGKTYRIEAKQSLHDATWIELVDRLSAQGLETTFVDTLTSGLDRVYYRVTENE